MKKIKHRASPIILAALCAVGVHTVLFTDAGHRMQGAITESSTQVNASDTSLLLNGDTLSLTIEKDITKVTKITASLIYNNESLSLSEPRSTLGNITNQTEDYSDNITLVFPGTKDVVKGTTLATWKIVKVLPEIHTINLSDVQVESAEGTTSLSTRGTGEF